MKIDKEKEMANVFDIFIQKNIPHISKTLYMFRGESVEKYYFCWNCSCPDCPAGKECAELKLQNYPFISKEKYIEAKEKYPEKFI